MTEAAVFTEPTTALRDWLRTLLSRADVYAGGLPASTVEGIVITRIGGPWLSPIDDGLYQFDCWDTTAPAAAASASALITALDAASQTVIDAETGLRFCGTGAVSALSLSDPSAPDRYRSAVTAELVTKTVPVPAP